MRRVAAALTFLVAVVGMTFVASPTASATERVECRVGDRTQVRVWYKFDAFEFCQAFRGTPDNYGLDLDPVIGEPVRIEPGDNSGYFRSRDTGRPLTFGPSPVSVPVFIRNMDRIQVDCAIGVPEGTACV